MNLALSLNMTSISLNLLDIGIIKSLPNFNGLIILAWLRQEKMIYQNS